MADTLTAPSRDEEAQSIYNELNTRGVFKQDPEAQAIGHELRARGVVVDASQGGLAPSPASAPSATPDQAMDQFGRIAADFATNPLTGAIVSKQAASGQNLQAVPSPSGDILARNLPGGGLQYKSPNGTDPFAVPGSPVAQYEKSAGGLKVRTAQNGSTRVVGANGQPAWFDAQGKPMMVPPGQGPQPVAAPDYVGGVQQAIGDAGAAAGNTLARADRAIVAPLTGAAMRTPTGRVLQSLTGVTPHQAQEATGKAYTAGAQDAAGVAAGVPSFALGAAKAVGANVGAALAKDPALKAQAEAEADQFSKDFVGSVIGAPHLDPSDPNAHAGWAAQAYKAIGYLHNGDRASATEAAKNVAGALVKGAEEHPVMAVLGLAGGAAGLMGMRGHALETLEQAKDAAEAVGDTKAAEGAKQASEQITASAPVEPVNEPAIPAATAQHPAWQAYDEALKPKTAPAESTPPVAAIDHENVTPAPPAEAPKAENLGTPVVTTNTKPTLTYVTNSASFKNALVKHFGLSEDEATNATAIADARADEWSKATGRPAQEWYQTHIAAVGKGTATGATLNQQETPTFYSQAEKVVQANPQKAMRADQWQGFLNSRGVKPEEMKWTGLWQFLDDNTGRSITKQEVLDHLTGNQVQLNEIVHGGGSKTTQDPAVYDDIQRSLIYYGAEPGEASDIVARAKSGDADAIREIGDYGIDTNRLNQIGHTTPTQYHTYTLPGGKNYREMLLQLPPKSDPATHEAKFSALLGELGLKYEEPGYNAQRVGSLSNGAYERLSPTDRARYDDAERGLGENYKSTHWEEPNVLAHIRMSDRTGPNGEKVLHVEEIQSDWHQQGRKEGYVTKSTGEQKEWTHTRVPDAPFSKTWHELAAKKVLDYAARNGYDKVAWTPGKEQGERYSEDNGGPKDQARTVGMQGFYDKILPDTFNKLGKRFGAKVGETEIGAGDKQEYYEEPREYGRVQLSRTVPNNISLHSIPVTGEMRRSLTTEGQPLFQGPKGSVQFLDDNRAIIRAMDSPDISTVVHELGHVFRRDLEGDDLKTVEDWAGVKAGKWEVDHEEKFARGFERYLADGNAPTPALATVFEKFKGWLTAIYKGITGSSIDVKVSPEVKAVMDRLLGKGAEAETPKMPANKVNMAPREASFPDELEEGKYAGSTNVTRLEASGPTGERVLINTAAKLPPRDVRTHQGTLDAATDLADSVDKVLDKLKPGEMPVEADGSPVRQDEYWTALRLLTARYTQRLVDAEARYAETPTPENEAAVKTAQDEQFARQYHSSVFGTRQGQSLASGNIVVDPLSREAAAERVLRAPSRDMLPKEESAPAGKMPRTRTPKGDGQKSEGLKRTPRSPRQPKWNPVPEEEAAPLLASLKSKYGKGEPVLKQQPEGAPETLHQAAEPISHDDFKNDEDNFVKAGLYHLSHGAGTFDKWTGKMREIAPSLTKGQAETLWQKTKNAAEESINKGQVTAAKGATTSGLIPMLGNRKAVEAFLDQVNDENPEIVDKWLSGDAFTQDEKDTWTRALADNKADRKPSTPSQGPLKVAAELAAEVRAQTPRKPGPPLTKDQQILRSVASRVTPGKAPEVIRRLGATPEGKAVIDALKSDKDIDKAQSRLIADAIKPDLRTANRVKANAISQRLSDVMRSARAGKLGGVSAKDVVREHFQHKYIDQADRMAKAKGGSDEATVAAQAQAAKNMEPVNRDLAKISPDDWGALADVVNKHDSKGWDRLASNFGAMYRGNLLSNTAQLPAILASHVGSNLWEKSVVDPLASLLDSAYSKSKGVPRALVSDPRDALASVGAVPAGLRAAGRILARGENTNTLHSENSLPASVHELRGEFNVGLDKVADRIKNTTAAKAVRMAGVAVNSPWRFWNRQHGAVFSVAGVPIYDNALRDAARLKAVNDGLKGADQDAQAREYYNSPTVAMEDEAARHWQEKMFSNPNAYADFVAKLDKFGPAGKVVKAIFQPFAGIPANLAGRAIETATPAGLIKGLSILSKGAENITPFDRANALRSIVRSIGGVTAGALAYQYAHKAGLDGVNEEAHRYSPTLTAGGRRTEIGRLAPLVNPASAGATLREKGGGLMGAFTRDYVKSVAGEGPYMGLGSVFDELFPEQEKGHSKANPVNKVEKGIARALSGLLPGSSLLNATSAQFDPTHGLRWQKTPLDTVANKIPGPPVTIRGQAVTRQALKPLGIRGAAVPEAGGFKVLRSVPTDAAQRAIDARDEAAMRRYAASLRSKH